MLTTSVTYLESIVTALTTQDKHIKFKSGKSWCANIKNRTLEYDARDLTKLSPLACKGLILHETGHLKYTEDNTKISKIEQVYPAMHEVYNALEDIRIENKLMIDYGQFATDAIKQTATSIFQKNIKIIMSDDYKDTNKLDQYLLNMIALNHRGNFAGTINNNQDRVCYELMNGITGLLDKYNHKKVTDLIYSRDFDKIISDIKSCKNLQEVKDYTDNNLFKSLEPFIKEYKEKDKNDKAIQATRSMGIDNIDNPVNSMSVIPSDSELNILLAPYIQTLTNKLMSVLQENASTRYTGAYKSGRLTNKGLYKVALNDKYCFSKKNNLKNKPDYTVSLLLDESGSMAGERHTNTYMASYLLVGTCEKLNIPVNLIKYSSNAIKINTLLKYKTDFVGLETNDKEAINLLKNSLDYNKNNLIFIITDGKSQHNIKPDIIQLTRQDCQVIGIGIGDKTNVKNIYPQAIEVQDASLLPKLLINILQKIIHR